MICPKCKTKVSKDDANCPKCKLKLIFKCPRCGSLTRLGSVSCKECGFTFVKFCPNCHSTNYATSSICRKCNHEFKEENLNPIEEKQTEQTINQEQVSEEKIIKRTTEEPEEKPFLLCWFYKFR